MKVRFNVAEITRYGNDGGTKVVLLPLIGHAPENNVLWRDPANPAGRIELHMSAPDAESLFEMGEYIVEFTKVEEAVENRGYWDAVSEDLRQKAEEGDIASGPRIWIL